MRIAEVIGTVTLSRCHPSLAGYRWIVGVPFSLKALRNSAAPDGEDVVILDELGAGEGQRIGVSEGVEAMMPFHPLRKPVDAYGACILDALEVK
ncbi:MAG: carbon dioxide concentrating mechanism protein CcmL [Planctomycetes bacterium]|nr:carbon dioxide concentrating mechanism protein CcmL [Planctomycetota bacterium]